MTKREAQRIVAKRDSSINYYWQGSELIRTQFDPIARCNRVSIAGNCYDCTPLQAERVAWLAEALV